jgi:hypothetical protein
VDGEAVPRRWRSTKPRSSKYTLFLTPFRALNEKYGENMSVMSDMTTATHKTHAEKNLGRLEQTKKAKAD